MISDMELTEQLRNIYENTGIDLLETEATDKPSPERVEEKKAVSGYVAKVKRELYDIGHGVELCADYECRRLHLGNVDKGIFIPFDAIPNLIQFLEWLCDEKPVGKEK